MNVIHPQTSDLMYSDQYMFVTDTRSSTPEKPKVTAKEYSQRLVEKFKKFKSATPRIAFETPPFLIDAVFTWVSDTPEHSASRQLWLSRQNSSVDSSQNRFANHDELRFAIRSIYDFAPWVRRIFVVVDDKQYPAWLKDDSASASIPVFVVPHSLIYGEYRAHLPTFNSFSIECHLHNIPQLSDTFIYFNDDMFFGKPCQWSEFFTKEGLPKYKLEQVITKGPKIPTECKYVLACMNNCTILDEVFPDGEQPMYHMHQACPMLKKSFVDAWSHPVARSKLLATSAARFRTSNDVYLIGLLVNWNRCKKLAESTEISNFYTQLSDNQSNQNAESEFCKLLQQTPAVFCINDGMAQTTPRLVLLLRTFLQFYFRTPSPVEKKLN